MNAYNYINSVVGKPWVNRAEGPDAFDCFGIVIDSFRKVDGIEIPVICGYSDGSDDIESGFDIESNSGAWRKSQARDGAVMVAYNNDKPAHVGRCIAGGVLHALGNQDGQGSVQFHDYKMLRKIFNRVEYYALNNSQP